MARLVQFVNDQDSDEPVHVMALALRAALSECWQELETSAAAVADSPADGRGESGADRFFAGLCMGRIEMANKVVRRVSEYVSRLGRRTPAAPIEDRSEVVDVLGEWVGSEFRRDPDGFRASRGTVWRAWLADDEWTEMVGFVLDGLQAAGFSIVRDPAVCGDYPAPCNCDDPLLHNGH
jgi:hypothetical protein